MVRDLLDVRMTGSGGKIVLLAQEDDEAAASCREISYLMFRVR
jgi:hypothetical protein